MVSRRKAPELRDLDRAADERTTLTGMLDHYRTVLVRKAWDLDEQQLATAPLRSSLTLGGLVLHMALVEDSWFDHTFLGHDDLEPWASVPWESDPDWEFRTAADWDRDSLLARFEASVARSRAVVEAAPSLDQIAVRKRTNTSESSSGESESSDWNLRWIMVHMIEEYARHCGHADMIREAIDGVTDN